MAVDNKSRGVPQHEGEKEEPRRLDGASHEPDEVVDICRAVGPHAR